MSIRRESSADSAARFLVSRKKRERSRRRTKVDRTDGLWRDGRWMKLRLSIAQVAPREIARPRRIVLDIAEPTLRLIHDVLCDEIGRGRFVLGRLNLLLIAEQMIAQALGEPPCDDPTLTDREGQ